MGIDWVYREKRILDLPYVWETSISILREDTPYCWMDKSAFRRFGKRLEQILRGSEYLVASSTDDLDYIAGFCAHIGPHCLILYAREIHRGRGLGSELLKRAIPQGSPWFFAHSGKGRWKWFTNRGGRFDPTPLWIPSTNE